MVHIEMQIENIPISIQRRMLSFIAIIRAKVIGAGKRSIHLAPFQLVNNLM